MGRRGQDLLQTEGETTVERKPIPNTEDGKKRPEPIVALFLFPEAGDPYVNDSVERVLKEFPQVEVRRWDKLRDVENTMQALEDNIRESDLILVVLDTLENDFNDNTLYELGFAHALRRKVISIMSQANKRRLPHDLLQRPHVMHGNVLDKKRDGPAFEDRLRDACHQHLDSKIDSVVKQGARPSVKKPERPRTPIDILNKRIRDTYGQLKPDEHLAAEFAQIVDDINEGAARTFPKTQSHRERLEYRCRRGTDLLCRMTSLISAKTAPLFSTFVLLASCLVAALPILPLVPHYLGDENVPSRDTWQAFVDVILLLGVSLAFARMFLMAKPTRLRIAASAVVLVLGSLVATRLFILFQANGSSSATPYRWASGTIVVLVVAGGLLYFTRSGSLTYAGALKRASIGAVTTALAFSITRLLCHWCLVRDISDRTPLESLVKTFLALALSFVVILLVRTPWLLTRAFWCDTMSRESRPLPLSAVGHYAPAT